MRDAQGDAVTLQAPTLGLALIAAEINLASGEAEVWEGDRMLARVLRQPGTPRGLWRINAD